MNPFELYGPQFLVFYAVFAAVVVAILAVVRRQAEAGPPPAINLEDPYMVSYLRGGANEALRLATISLIDRRLLEIDGNQIRPGRSVDAQVAHRSIERAVMSHFKTGAEAKSIFNQPSLTPC